MRFVKTGLLIGVVLMHTSVFPQSKVGTTGAQFLSLPTSVRALGIGLSGVSLLDPTMHRRNAASLALGMEEAQFLFSLDPLVSNLPADISMYEVSGMYAIGKQPDKKYYFATALSYQRLNSGDMIERDYYQGTYEGTGSTFSWKDNAVTLTGAYAYTGRVNFGLGVSVLYVNESAHDYSANGVAFSLGGLFQWEITPDLQQQTGYSFTNLSLGGAYDYLGPKLKMINTSYPLPRELLLGISCEFGIKNMSGKIWSLTGIAELSDVIDNQSVYHLGLEANLHTWVALRGGILDGKNNSSTYGFSVQVDRLFSMVFPAIKKPSSFLRNLSITYSFAIEDYETVTNTNYHGVIISIH